MYTENVEYLSSSSFTFDFKHGFGATQVLCIHGLDYDGGCYTVYTHLLSGHLLIVIAYLHFQIITKGDRNLG
jgi:hypothetical protein